MDRVCACQSAGASGAGDRSARLDGLWGQARQVFGYDFDLLAEEHGFIAVYPQGYEGDWNDCKVKGPFAAKSENVDDVGFLHALVDRLVTDHDADRAHIYVTGVSNGGAMTIRLALQTPDFARAYAAVVASVPAPENMIMTPKGKPVSMLLMNGTADPMSPWDGSDIAFYGLLSNRGRALSAQASIDYFLKLDGVRGPPAKMQFPDTDTSDGSTAERQRWSEPGKRTVTLIRIEGGGHGVPHPATYGWRQQDEWVPTPRGPIHRAGYERDGGTHSRTGQGCLRKNHRRQAMGLINFGGARRNRHSPRNPAL